MNAEVASLPITLNEVPDASRCLQEFEDLLHECCSLTDEHAFWNIVGDGIRSIERDLPGEQAVRFEYGVDRILALHGLPAWSAIKPVR